MAAELSEALARLVSSGSQHLTVDITGLDLSPTQRPSGPWCWRPRHEEPRRSLTNPQPAVARLLSLMGVVQTITVRAAANAGSHAEGDCARPRTGPKRNLGVRRTLAFPAAEPWPRTSMTPRACSPRPPDLLSSSSLCGGQLEDKRDAGTARAGERLHLVRDSPRYPQAVTGQLRKRIKQGRGICGCDQVAVVDLALQYPSQMHTRSRPFPRHGRPHWPPARERPRPHPRPGHERIPTDRQEPALRLAGYTGRRSRTPGQGEAGHRPQPCHLPDSYRPFAAGISVYAKRVIVADRPSA